jgi:hypothetical protein
MPALTMLLLGALALRFIIAYVLFPGGGFETDISSFTSWANTLVDHGPGGFYGSVGFADYLPGYLYILWLVGLLGHGLAAISGADPSGVTAGLLKLPSIAADIAIGWVLYRLARRWIGDRPGAERRALIVAALYLFNPVTWYDSALWGQVDAVGTLVALVAVALLIEGHSEGASAMTVLAALVKPQFGVVLLPILGAVLLRRHLLRPGSGPRMAGGPAFLRTWAGQEVGAWRLVSSAAAGVLALYLVITPFGLDVFGLARRIALAAGTYPHLTVNAYNPWAFVGSGGAQPMAFAGLGRWSSDMVPLLGPLPGVVIGTVLLAVVFLVGIGQLLRRADRRSILLGAAYLSLAFFLLPTRVHERYLFPVFVFLPLLALFERRLVAATILIGLASFLNLHGILTEPLWGTANVENLVLGDVARDPLVIALCVAVALGIFALLSWRSVSVLLGRRDVFRPGTAALMALGGAAASRPEAPSIPLTPDPPPPGAMAGAVAVAPWLEQVGRHDRATPASGVVSRPAPSAAVHDARPALERGPSFGLLARLRRAFDAHVETRSLRRDRSAALADEPRGRLDRLDLMLIPLVVVAALTLRIWRVGEPADMYFDEVYHARTATEFLQDWRYGEAHSIYEFTHPHLAKYLIAAGIVAFGRNEVSATAELGFAARDAAIETAWDPIGGGGSRRGDRLYVSGPDGVRVYDLASRATIATIALADGAQPGALVVDGGAHRLLVADLTGGLWAFETTALDDLRAGSDAASLPVASRLGDLGAPARTLALQPTPAVIYAVLDDGRVVAVDAGSGASLAEATVPGAADVVSVAGGERLVVDAPAAPDAEAVSLATLLGEDVARVRGLLAGAGGDVVVASALTTEQRSAAQAAIDAGTLTATRLETGRLAAVAATEGLVLLDAVSLVRVKAFPTAAPATGLALVDKVSSPTLYVAAGSELRRIEIGDKDPPVERDRVWMPGPVRDVLFDPATKLVHVLGTTPDGLGDTVYVVEPHGNAVFADARLPARPVAWALDAQPDHPTEDREQLLTVAADGSLAVVEAGGNAFGWRFPGVIAGALMAGLLYLLARLLVRRRSVALLVAGLLLLDGMAFAQARIAMNDSYAGLFIVAAYTAFAALWLGAWRGRTAVLLGLPLVGLLLGLALATKWIGLYAIGGIVLLVLLRSALGRIVALAAMIGLSGVLGWLAISAPSSGSPGVVGMTAATALVVGVTFVVLRRLRVSGASLIGGLLFSAITTAVLLLVRGDALFLVLVVGLTLLLAVAMVLRPVFLTLEELRFGVVAPGFAGAVVGLGSILLRSALPAQGPFSGPALLVGGMLLVGTAIAAYAVVAMAGRLGLGPLAPLAPRDAPESRLAPPAPAPEGWLLPGWRWGIPWLWALLCFTALPLAVYVASYIPWVELGNRWTETLPAGHTGQTFLALQVSMYDYHNNLRATHAASSPWWAWPFDLKPVWFYLGTIGGRTALIYDAGNLVLFWLSVPAMGWAAWMAWRRRSLALTLVVLAFACQWLPWSRVDRATFQYHYYASLPFVLLALAYLLAELWHGPAARTWLMARLAVAATIVATPLLWLFRDPLCAVSGVLRANPGSQACGYVREAFVLSDRAAAALVVLVIGFGLIAWRARRPGSGGGGPDQGSAGTERALPARAAWLLAALAATVVALVLVLSLVPETPLIAAPVGLIALYVVAAALLLPLAFAAWLALGIRDPRRLVIGVLGAAALWFIVFYPDIAALALPTGLSRLFQVLPLPTYNYDFQFAVNTAAAEATSVLGVEALSLAGMVAFLAVAAMYATWTWRLAIAAETTAREPEAVDAVG